MVTTIAYGPDGTPIRQITYDFPWRWLAAGWADTFRKPWISLSYGFLVTLASWVLTELLLYGDMLFLVLPLAAAFMLLGPMLAVGLYEMSRRLETGERTGLNNVLFVATKSPLQLAFMGLLLTLFFLAWVRIATLIFALFFGFGFPTWEQLVPTLLLTPQGLIFLIVGTAVGAVLALAVFAISAVSVPMLMDRDVDALSATITSIQSVRHNLGPMLLWGWLIALITAFGIGTLFVGLIVTFPLIGHATWHAYRDLLGDAAVERQGASSGGQAPASADLSISRFRDAGSGPV